MVAFGLLCLVEEVGGFVSEGRRVFRSEGGLGGRGVN